MKRTFKVNAIWDDEDQVWVSESDIRGLHLEASTLEEFIDLVNEFASELIATNHYSEAEMQGKTLREIIPTVVVTQSANPGQAA